MVLLQKQQKKACAKKTFLKPPSEIHTRIHLVHQIISTVQISSLCNFAHGITWVGQHSFTGYAWIDENRCYIKLAGEKNHTN